MEITTEASAFAPYVTIIVACLLKIVGAIVIWIVGRWLIKLGIGLLDKQLEGKKVDSTLRHYLRSFLSIALTVILIIAILGFFGVETTTFAAVVAAGGVAIGLAWSGLLANLAAGVFLVILRPFKVGDVINAAGVTGAVTEIGLFSTTVTTPDNVKTIIGNNKIFSDNIQNYSDTPFRRVDLTAQLASSADHAAAIVLLKAKISTIPNVLSTPEPVVEILEFSPMGPVLAVRPFCTPDNYWQVYFDSNRVIREELSKAGFPRPEQAMVVRNEVEN